MRPRTQWLCLFALLALCAGLLAWTYGNERERLERIEHERLQTLLRVVGAQLDSSLIATDRALQGVIADHLAAPGGPSSNADISRRLRALTAAMPALRTAVVLDGRGSVIAASDEQFLGADYAARDYFRRAMEGQINGGLYLSPPLRSARGDIVVAAARVQPGAGGRPAAVAVAAFDPAHFSAMLGAFAHAPDMRVSLARGQDVWLALGPPDALAPLAVERRVAPPGLLADSALVVRLSRSRDAATYGMARDWRRSQLLFGLLMALACGALWWLQRRRHALADLQQARARERAELAAIFEHVGEALILFDAGGRVVRANGHALALHGLFAPALSPAALGNALETGIAYLEAGQARAATPLRAALAGQCLHQAPITLRRADNDEQRVTQISTVQLRGADAGSLWLMSCRDVTEQQLAQALRASEARFRTLIEDAPLAIAILRGGRFLYTNPRYRALHGYAADDDLAALPWRAMLAPASHAALAAQESLIAADADTEQKFEAIGLGKGGMPVPVFKTTSRVALADGPATLVFAQDISAQKDAENALLLARDAAEAASRGKAEFLANMSHEIRSPLNAMLGLAYLVEQSRLPADARDMIRRLRNAGRSLLGIVNDILDVSKIEAGHMHIEQAPFSLADIVERLADSMGMAAADKQLELIIHPLPEGVDSLCGDALRLEQVLVNLTSNAIKFTESGLVEVRCAVDRREGDALLLRFEVRDTGIGIAPAIVADMFSPFAQADTSTTRRFGGTGLGLTICRQLVGLMGGQIGADSRPGAGSLFHFTLPCVQLARAGAPAPAALDVLIADDSPLSLQALAAQVGALQWRALLYDSGEALLAALLARPPQAPPAVLLLDWNMPGLDGLATARAVRALVQEAQYPVLIMSSAYALATLANNPEAELIDAVLTKPITTGALREAVEVARRRRASAVAVETHLVRGGGMALAGLHVLVVDDNEINRAVAGKVLELEGATTSQAGDGQAALHWLQAHPGQADVVLMDVQMPVLDGLEATRRLRMDPRFTTLPVIALTAGAFGLQQSEALAAGMDHFVSKPFDVPSLVALVGQVGRGAPGGHGASPPAPAAPAPVALDVAQGMAIWHDLDQYRLYLGWFDREYGRSDDLIGAALARGDAAGAGAEAHKVAGVAGNLGLAALLDAAGALERALGAGPAPAASASVSVSVSVSDSVADSVANSVARYGAALAQARAAIARFCPTEETLP